jgi:hypothetical protein
MAVVSFLFEFLNNFVAYINGIHTYIAYKGGKCLLSKKNERFELAFSFPTLTKEVQSLQLVTLEPLWEYVTPVHVVGLYRIACRVTVDGEKETPVPVNAIAVEHIDLQGDEGYFEYALPFERFFERPLESLQLEIVEPDVSVQRGQAIVRWQARAVLEEQQKTVQKAEVVQQEIVKEKPQVITGNTIETPPSTIKTAVEPSPKTIKIATETPPKTIKTAVEPPPENKQSNVFLNDLVEQYSIWRSDDLHPQQQSYNNE